MPDDFPHLPADVRLVVSDMDGTLLLPDGTVPGGFWPLLEVMRQRGITFVPASGRQCATLQRSFAGHTDGMPFIAENGTYVVRDGVELSSATLSRDATRALVRRVRELVADGADLGVVVCGKASAYVERHDDAYRAEALRYYARLAFVDDVLTASADDEVIKVAVFDFDDAVATAPRFDDLRDGHQIVVSGRHWIDVMREGVNKGSAVRELQGLLAVTPEQTVVFGDYFNDAEMLQEAAMSFAMANGHPQLMRIARYVAPANSEAGVVTVLARLLGVTGGPPLTRTC